MKSHTWAESMKATRLPWRSAGSEFHTRRTLYGWAWDSGASEWKTVPEEQENIRQISVMRLSELRGINSIATAMNNLGSRWRGAHWRSQHIAYAFPVWGSHPIYADFQRWGADIWAGGDLMRFARLCAVACEGSPECQAILLKDVAVEDYAKKRERP